jgi:protein involved in temperature-dependent protein secretion
MLPLVGTLEDVAARIEEGDFLGASRLCAPAFAASPNPAFGIYLLFAQCANLDFSGAKQTLERLSASAPAMRAVWKKVESCASAEWTRHARARDPRLAGGRAGLGTPSPVAALYARAEQEHASKSFAAAKATLEEIGRMRPRISGVARTREGAELSFVDLMDTDDVTGVTFPVFQEGAVVDLALTDLRSLVFSPRLASDPFHGLWPSVTYETREGARATAQFPTLYVGSTVSAEPLVRLGRITTFEHSAGYCVAQGLRDFWVVTAGDSRSTMGVTAFERFDFAA